MSSRRVVTVLRKPPRADFIDSDGGKAPRRDAQSEVSSVIITAPGRQRAASRDFLDQSIGQELADRLLGEATPEALRRVNGCWPEVRHHGCLNSSEPKA